VQWDLQTPGEKIFTATMIDGSVQTFSRSTMTQVMGLTLDGLRGLSPLALFRMGISLSIAGEKAQGRSFGGAQNAGFATVPEDVNNDETESIHRQLMNKVGGIDHVNDIAVINRDLKFVPYGQNNVEAQFQEGRRFQIDEVARMFGIPGHLLDETKTSSWGTGIAEQNRGLASFVLRDWTTGLQEALSGLLPKPQFVEFDYSALLQGSPADEVALLMAQTGNQPILTVDEARAIRNMPPMKTDTGATP
jgi:HK97 family phage portal protein